MAQAVPSPLEAWANFYVILGSSAAALTGLQFVVLTLVAQANRVASGGESLAAFGSPNVVHFCAALLVSCALSAPWPALGPAGVSVAICGAAGLLYSGIVIRRAHRQTEYQPVFEDWLFHTMLPPLAYLGLLASGILLAGWPVGALFVSAGAVVLLVSIGIHNAWDTVTYITLEQIRRERAAREGPAARRSEPPTGESGKSG
jgi:hypothetical protein